MNPNHCSLTGKHDPVKNQDWFQCRWCHKKMESNGIIISTDPQVRFTDKDSLYKQTVDYYLKKNYSVEQANHIAQSVVEKYLVTHPQNIVLDSKTN